MAQESVRTSFAQIEAWLDAHAPALNSYLNPPASLEQINYLEQQIGCRLPVSVREAYHLHDGEAKASDGLYGTWRWLPLAEVLAVHEEHCSIEAEYHFGDFLPALMIPLMQSGGGDLYYIEYCGKPSESDASDWESEVIEWFHEQPTREVIAASFARLWKTFANGLEAGEYVYRPDDLQALLEEDEL
ncbi:MAG: SMI1/KNR4 family protein [Candidatus Sericytochromatia bacterium]